MAVFGIFGLETADVASSTYYGLYALQHRGQASSGIVVNDDGVGVLRLSDKPGRLVLT